MQNIKPERGDFMINFKEYHYNENGKKVAGTAHQIHQMALPDPFVAIPKSKHKLDPFVIIKSEKKNKNK